MKFKCYGTGSKGNSYSITNDAGEILLIDLGLSAKDIKDGIDYKISNVVGACVSHTHNDHSKSMQDFKNMGIQIFAPYLDKSKTCKFGGFKVQAFELPHDETENYGFLIQADGQKILYLTDFEYCKYSFAKLKVQHIIIECNYQKELVDKDLPQYEHKIRGHSSFDVCRDFIDVNKSEELRSVTLIHYGEGTCHIKECVEGIKQIVEPDVVVDYARKGWEMEMKLFPF